MEYRGAPIGDGGGWELFLFLVPIVFVALLVRKFIAGKTFTAVNVFEVSYVLMFAIGAAVTIAVVVAFPALIAAGIANVFFMWTFNATLEEVQNHIGPKLVFFVIYALTIFYVYRLFREKD